MSNKSFFSIISGFKGKTLPNLQKQETNSLLCSLRILYKVYCDHTRVDDWSKTEVYLHRFEYKCTCSKCNVMLLLNHIF